MQAKWLRTTAAGLAAASSLCLPGCAEVTDIPAEVPTWVVSASPSVSIGTAEGEDPYLLFGVTGATRLSDGRIVAANCSSAELRYFDDSGRHIRTVGGKGEGPGEIRFRMQHLFPALGDTVVVVENLLVEYIAHLFGPDGDYARSTRFENEIIPKGRLADGRFVGMRTSTALVARTELNAGIDTVRATLFTLAPDGTVSDSLAGKFMREVEVEEGGIWRPLRFGANGMMAVHEDGLVWADHLAGTLELISPTLDRVSEWTVGEPGRLLSVSDAEEWTAHRESIVPEGSNRFASYSGLVTSEKPSYGDIVTGADGAIWVQDPEEIGDYPLVWTSYVQGEAVARLQLPPRFFPFEFGEDWVLGVSFDSSNIERVELYAVAPGEFEDLTMSHYEAAVPYVVCGPHFAR